VIHLLCWIDQVNKVIAVAIFLGQRLRVALFEVPPFQFILFIQILRVTVIIVLGALLGVDIGISQNQLIIFQIIGGLVRHFCPTHGLGPTAFCN
jgi:ABC-type anion transport system duplicated permease subunit